MFIALLLMALLASVSSSPCFSITTLAVGLTFNGDICSPAAFTSGANSVINGNIDAIAAVTLGASSIVNGSVTSGAAFTSGASSIVYGSVNAGSDVTLGASSIVYGAVTSATNVISYGNGATIGTPNTPPSNCMRPTNNASTITSSQCPSPINNGTSCTPICASGYHANGTLTITCINGTLTNPVGTCNPDPCIRPGDLLSTTYSTYCPLSVPSGSFCIPACENGYTASASLQIDCTASIFSMPVGTCNPNPCLTPIGNSNITYSICSLSVPSGASCIPGCNIGYSPTASLSMVCTLGNYSSPNGYCAANPCDRPVDTVSVSYLSCLAFTSSSSKCTPTCQSGYAPSPTSDLSIICYAQVFQFSSTTCQPSTCSTPAISFPYTAGNCIGPILSGSTCSYGCEVGYIASGRLTASCIFGVLTFIGNEYCANNTDSSCSQPTPNYPLTAGDCPPASAAGSECMIGCVDKYTPSHLGDFVAHCDNQTFAWNIHTAICIPNSCVPTDLILPSSMSLGNCSSILSGDFCSASCLPGFTQHGSLEVTCFAGSFSTINEGSCTPMPCNPPTLPPSTGKKATACNGQVSSGGQCIIQCINGYTPIGNMTLTCSHGNFTSDSESYCVGVDDVFTSSSSLNLKPPVRVSHGSRLNITLSRLGTLPFNMIVSNYTLNGIFADVNFRVPFLSLQNETISLTVYVSSPTFGVVALTQFQSHSILYLQTPDMKSVCPNSILAQVSQSVVIQGTGFVASSSLVCVLNGILSSPAVLSNPTAITCDLYWPDATPNQVISLNVANDGSLDSFFIQTSIFINIKGACENEKPGSIATNTSGCQCPAGTADTGSNCAVCDDGFYQSQTGKTSCTPCGIGKDTYGKIGSKSIDDCVCAPRYFASEESSWNCINCPVGMDCPGNNVEAIVPGFWRASQTTSAVLTCGSTSCSSSSHTGDSNTEGTGLARCLGSSNSTVSLCADGYTGPLCSVCSTGYARLGNTIDPAQVRCIQCPTSKFNTLALIVLLLLACVLASLLIRSAAYTSDININTSSREKKEESVQEASLNILFKVFLNYLQVLYYLSRLASNWSDLAVRFFNAIGIVAALSPSNYNIQCAANWNYWDTLIFVYISPVIVIVVTTIFYGLRHVIKKLDRKKSKTDCQLAVMVLLYQIHPTIMLEVLSSFSCQTVGGTGTSYLKRDMSIDCKSSKYATFAAISGIYMVIYVIGLVVVVVARLRYNYKVGRLNSPEHNAYQKYAFFFCGYRRHLYFWEAVIMMRKMAIVAFSVLAAPMLQLVFGIVIITISLFANIQYSPFNSLLINRIESLSLISLYITIILGFIFLYSCGQGNTIWIAVLLIVVNSATIVFILGCCLKRIREFLQKLEINVPNWLVNVQARAKSIRISRNSLRNSMNFKEAELKAF